MVISNLNGHANTLLWKINILLSKLRWLILYDLFCNCNDFSLCRLLYLPVAVLAALIGIIIDVPVISTVALFKCPYMLFKGWHRLFHDLIGREGPFLETICVPFAGLAILLWPLAVAGAVVVSMFSGYFIGAYAGVVAYQVNSHIFPPSTRTTVIISSYCVVVLSSSYSDTNSGHIYQV